MIGNSFSLFEVLCLAGLLAGLAIVVRADWQQMRIPDAASLPLIVGGVACSAIAGRGPGALAGALVGYAFFVAIEHLYRLLRGRDGLGRGDAKLMAAAGAWVGVTGLPTVLLIAAAGGLAFALATGARNKPIPFAPFISLGLLAVHLGLPPGGF